MARAVRLFRGSELPRLLVLFAIVAVGWPLVWWKMRPIARAVAPPVPIAAAKPLPPPDSSPTYASIQDKTTPSFRDNAAYSMLLTRARETPPAELAAQSRADVPYTELWERPERYRGLPIHLSGTARRVLVHDELNPALAPSSKIYEAYVFTLESQHNPYILVFEEPPPGLPGGLDIQEKVSFDGYFLKLLAYQAGDRLRAAPMLVGRLHWTPPPPEDFDSAINNTLTWTMGGLSLLTLYALIRWALHLRRMMKPAALRRTIVAPPESIEPEVLSQWLERAETEADEPDDEESRQ